MKLRLGNTIKTIIPRLRYESKTLEEGNLIISKESINNYVNDKARRQLFFDIVVHRDIF